MPTHDPTHPSSPVDCEALTQAAWTRVQEEGDASARQLHFEAHYMSLAEALESCVYLADLAGAQPAGALFVQAREALLLTLRAMARFRPADHAFAAFNETSTLAVLQRYGL